MDRGTLRYFQRGAVTEVSDPLSVNVIEILDGYNVNKLEMFHEYAVIEWIESPFVSANRQSLRLSILSSCSDNNPF